MKKRINVSLDPEVYALLGRMAEVFGGSRSGALNDFFKEMSPAVEIIIQAHEKLRQGKQEGLIQALRSVVQTINCASNEKIDALETRLRSALPRSERQASDQGQAPV